MAAPVRLVDPTFTGILVNDALDHGKGVDLSFEEVYSGGGWSAAVC